MLPYLLIIGMIIAGGFAASYSVSMSQEAAQPSKASHAASYAEVSGKEVQRVIKWAEYVAARDAAKQGLDGAVKEEFMRQRVESELASYLNERGVYSFEVLVDAEASAKRSGSETYIRYGRYTVVVDTGEDQSAPPTVSAPSEPAIHPKPPVVQPPTTPLKPPMVLPRPVIGIPEQPVIGTPVCAQVVSYCYRCSEEVVAKDSCQKEALEAQGYRCYSAPLDWATRIWVATSTCVP